jgi:hypothetical protein
MAENYTFQTQVREELRRVVEGNRVYSCKFVLPLSGEKQVIGERDNIKVVTGRNHSGRIFHPSPSPTRIIFAPW